MVLRKLTFSHLKHRKVRAGLTISAIALSISLVVSVTSGFASVEAAVFKYVNLYMGTTDAEIVRTNDPGSGFPEELLERLRADPDVRDADGRYESASVLQDLAGKPGHRAALIGIRRSQDRRSDYLNLEKGRWFAGDDGNEAVIDQGVAASLNVDVGGEFIVPGPSNQLRMKVVGIVHKPAMLATFMQTVYLPLRTLQGFSEKSHVLSRMQVDLRRGVDPDAWAAKWQKNLSEVDPTIRLRLARDTRRQMSKNLQGIRVLSYLGGTVSMLAATFIVLSALSMGVTERQRTLAMLRAVGTTKRQLAALVVMEGLALAVIAAAIGVPLGWLWIRSLAWLYSDVFAAGVVVSWGGVLFGTLGSILAALAASLLPAWSATRVDPLEALAPQAAPGSSGPPWRVALVGLCLIAIDPFLFFGPVQPIVGLFGTSDPKALAENIVFVAHFALGLPGIMVGFFLLAPMFVWTIEKFGGPLVAAMYGLKPAMVRQQLTTGIWRAAGTCAALMVGLAVLIVMQTNGNTMLRGWRLPDRFPDVFIMSGVTSGLTWQEQAQLATVPGVKPGEVMPIAVASPEYGSKWYQIALAAVVPNATMYIAIDPDKAFKMMELDFRQGNSDLASKLLGQGQHLGLANGGTLDGLLLSPLKLTSATGETRDVNPADLRLVEALLPTTNPSATAPSERFRVTLKDGSTLEGGLTDLSLNAISTKNRTGEKTTVAARDLRRMDAGRYIVVTEEFYNLRGMGIGDVLPLKTSEGVKDFMIAGVVWSPGIDVMVGMFDMSRQFDQRTAYSVFGSLDDGRRYMGIQEVHLFAANLDPWFPKENLLKGVQARLGDRGMAVGDVREIKHNIQQGFFRLLLLVSTVAFAAMAVSALGVTNTIMASVRSRRWQFGVLRSIGVTRGQLVRLVLAEATLLGLVGVAMGLAAGFLMTLDANALSQMVIGYKPRIAVPWEMIWSGAGLVMLASLLASLVPAATLARSEPLQLLQAGRASA